MNLSKLLIGAAALVMLSSPMAFAQSMAGGAVKVAPIAGKNVLTDTKGMTLYTWDNDTAGKSTCAAACAKTWPAASAAADAKPAGDFTLADGADGKVWAYKGKALYTFAKDAKAGDMTGDGVGGKWHVAVQ